VSQGSRTSRVSHLSEHIGAIGSVVAGVVQDLLTAQREDSDRHMQLMMAQREDGERRQEVQMRMMLAHREETELRVKEARQSAERQMELMREMHEMPGIPLGTGGESPLSSRASTPSTPKAFEYHSEPENGANVNAAKSGVTQLDNCDTCLVQPGGNIPSVTPGYVLVPIGPSSTLGYAHSTL